MSLDKQFEQAQADTKTLTKRPSDTQLLDLYAFFKQGTEGDNDTKKPGKDDAKQKYVDLVNGLLETHK